MRIVTYSQDVISLFDSEFIAASLQDGLFTFTRPNGQVVEVKLPTRAEIEKLSHLSNVSKDHDTQTFPVSVSHKPSLLANKQPEMESSTSQAVVTNLPPDMGAPELNNNFGQFQPASASAPDSTSRKSPCKAGSRPSLLSSSVSTAPLLQKPNAQGTNNTKPMPVNKKITKGETTGDNWDEDSSLKTNVTPSSSFPGSSSNMPSLDLTNSQHLRTGGASEPELHLRQLEDLKARVTDLQNAWNEVEVEELNRKLGSLDNRIDEVKHEIDSFVTPAIEEIQDKVFMYIKAIGEVEAKVDQNFGKAEEDYEYMDSQINELWDRLDGKNKSTKKKKYQK